MFQGIIVARTEISQNRSPPRIESGVRCDGTKTAGELRNSDERGHIELSKALGDYLARKDL